MSRTTPHGGGLRQPPGAPTRVLPAIVLAQLAGTSPWFAVNAVMPELQREFGWAAADVGTLTSALQLGFIGFAAEFATTGAWDDNGPSLGVTAKLGYESVGHRRGARLGKASTMQHFELSRADFQARLQRDDIELVGVDECLGLLGLNQ